MTEKKLKCPVCFGPMKYRNEDFKFHAYDCVDEKCPGVSKCDQDCCRIMRPELAFDLIVTENSIPNRDWRYERIRQIIHLVHQHGVESVKEK